MAEKVIPAGLSAKTMRLRMEDKAMLTRKGSLYVGTGDATEGNQTEELEPGDAGAVLQAESGSSSGTILGWALIADKNIAPVGISKIASGAITTDKFASNAKAPQASYSDISGRADTSIFVETLSAEASTSTTNGDTITIKSGNYGSTYFNIKNAAYANRAGKAMKISLSTGEWKVFSRTNIIKDEEIALSSYSFYNVYATIYLTGEVVRVMFSPFYIVPRETASSNQGLFAESSYINNNGSKTSLILEIDTENSAATGKFTPRLKKVSSAGSSFTEISESYQIYFYEIAN